MCYFCMALCLFINYKTDKLFFSKIYSILLDSSCTNTKIKYIPKLSFEMYVSLC